MASCRACGGETHTVASCPACEESIQWKCDSCNKETDVSIHTHDGKIIGPEDIDIISRAETSVAAAT